MALKPRVQESHEIEVKRITTETIPKRIAVGGWLVIDITDEPWCGSADAEIPQHFAHVIHGPSRRLTNDELLAASEAFALAAKAQTELDNAIAMALKRVIR